MWLVTVEEAAAALLAGVVCILPTATFAWLSTRNVRAAQFVGLGVLKSVVTVALMALAFAVARPAPLGFFVALIAVYLSCFRTYRLARGERGVFMVMAADRRQARVVMRYVKGFLHSSPMLASLVARETQTEIELTNGVTLEIHTASFRLPSMIPGPLA